MTKAAYTTKEDENGADHLVVGGNGGIPRLSEAIQQARAGATISVEAGLYCDDFVLIDKPVRIVGRNGTPIFQAIRLTPDGGILRTSTDVEIENVAFYDAASLSGNAAGIRQITGTLTVRNCILRSSQNGIFCADDPNAKLIVEDSQFIGNGAGDGHTHGLYIATEAASLVVERSVFVGTHVGHHLKSRARQTEVRDSRFGDLGSGRTSYAIDIPNGGIGRISGNVLVQNTNAEHFALVNYGGEGMKYPSNALTVRGNTFTGNGRWLSVAVRNRSRVVVELENNRFENIRLRLWGRGRISR
jgi:hypothetical protein